MKDYCAPGRIESVAILVRSTGSPPLSGQGLFEPGKAAAFCRNENIWPLFGSANQLLSALALIACAVFLKKTKRKGWMLWAPMVIMLAVTLTALVQKIIALVGNPTAGNVLQLAFAVALFVLGIIVATLGLKRLAEKQTAKVQILI